MLAPGAVIDRYELVAPIGEGGMAQVWAARQRGKHGFEKLVALKAIHPRFAEDPKFRAMFLDEARLVSALEHNHVAQVFDLGEQQSLLFLVMEYVDGESLSALLVSAGKRLGHVATVPPGTALRIVADVCAGLHAAHKLTDENGKPRGVVHRDVSPQNILLGLRGDVKLIDFGIALMRDRVVGDTDEGSLKGKLHYMAPEQAKRERVGPQSDVFAAGAVLYRMLAGKPPYDGGTEAMTLHMLVSGKPPAPLPDSVNPLVQAIVDRALSLDPGDRYDSAAAMQNALEGAIAELGYIPNIAAWVKENTSDRARARRAELAAKKKDAPPPAVPDLATAMPTPSARSSEPPSAPVIAKDRSFMDVRKIAADRAQESKAPPAQAREQEVLGDGGPKYVGPATIPRKRIANAPRLTMLAIGVVLLVALAALGLFLLPMVARDRAVAAAREIGIELTIERVGVGFSGVTMRGIRATFPRLPGVTATADEIYASGFSAQEVVVRGADVKMQGSVVDLAPELVLLVDRGRGHFAGKPGSPRKITIAGARVAWLDVFGPSWRIDGREVGLEVESKGRGVEEVRFAAGSFDVTTPKTQLGPWAYVVEHNPQTTRARLLFDPPVPDGPSALYVYGPNVAPQLTVKIPRSPVARLGLRPEELGLPADLGTEVAVTIEGGRAVSGRIEAPFKVELFGARLKGVKNPVDVKLEGAANGAPGKELALEKTVANVGPFVADVLGSLTPHDQGFRVDATFRTRPIGCDKIARAEAKSMGPFAATLQELAQKTGAVRVYGTANAAGLVKYDTKAPDDATFTFTTKDSCGLSLFGL